MRESRDKIRAILYQYSRRDLSGQFKSAYVRMHRGNRDLLSRLSSFAHEDVVIGLSGKVFEMPPKFATEYVDRLLADETYGSLADLSSAICSSVKFNAESTDYGLPHFAFLFVETLLWFAQGERSGVWTYYEATPQTRQDAMLDSLRRDAPEEFSSWYERGMRDWSDEARITAVDAWIEAHGEAANRWLRALAANNRETLLEPVAE